MAVLQGIVRVRQHEQTVTFQVEGQVTMHQSPAVRQFAEHCLAHGATTLRVDLGKCTYMDSTFLGTLLFLKRAVDHKGQGEFVLLSPSPQCRQLLNQMRLEKVFPIVTVEEPATIAWTELSSELEDIRVFKRNVVQAHQELASLEGPAGEPFRALAGDLARELEPENARHLDTGSGEQGKNG